MSFRRFSDRDTSPLAYIPTYPESDSKSVQSVRLLTLSTLLVFGSYLALTMLMTWPMLAHLGSNIPGSEGDAWVHLWTFRWVRDALAAGRPIYFTDLIYFPHGVSLLQHNFAWLHIGLWLPLQAWLGEATAYALVFLVAFPFTAWTTFLLTRDLIGWWPGAYLAGIVAGFWPYALSHHNHPNLVFVGFVPLALLFTRRLFARPTWGNTAALALSVTAVGVVRWQMLVIAGFLMGGYGLFVAVCSFRRDTGRWITAVKRLFAAAGVSLLLSLPLLWPLLAHELSTADVSWADSLTVSDLRNSETDLWAYLVPSRYHPVWGRLSFDWTENFIANRVFTPFLGYVTLLLAGLAWQRPRARVWLGLAAVHIVLAVGGVLTVNGRDLWPMPYQLLEQTSLAALVRESDRFNVVLGIPMGIAAAYGLHTAVGWAVGRGGRWAGWIAIGAAVGLVSFEYATVYPLLDTHVPVWYADTLAAEEGHFGIASIPRHPRHYDEYYLPYQAVHGKPLTGGHVSRLPDEATAFMNRIPILAEEHVNGRVPHGPDVTAVGRQLAALAQVDVRYLVLHKQFLSKEQTAAWRDLLVVPPTHEDDELVVYQTAVSPGDDYPFAPLGAGVGLVRGRVDPTETAQDGWLTINVVWGSDRPITADLDVCWVLHHAVEGEVQRQCGPVAAEWPTATWLEGEILPAAYRMQITPYLDGGEYALTAELVDATGQTVGAQTVETVQIAAQSRTFERPEMPEEIETDWGWADEIELDGYVLSEDELTLIWRAQERPEQSAVVFVHLVDAESGELIAQVDRAPRNWAYPTHWWEAGEYVRDDIPLPTAELPPGRYEVRLGLYDVETQIRLLLADGTDAVMLPEILEK